MADNTEYMLGAVCICITIFHKKSATILFLVNLAKFYYTEVKFLVLDWGGKVDTGIVCHTGLQGYMYIGWQAATTTQSQSQLYPPFKDYEFG